MNLTDEHLRAIGRVAVMYSRLDLTLTAFVGRLLCPDDDAGLVLGGILSTRQKRELLGLPYARLPGAAAALRHELDQLLQAARLAEDDRNRLMHAPAWGEMLEDGTRVTAVFKTSRNTGAFTSIRMAVDDVEQIAARLETVGVSLGRFMRVHLGQTAVHYEPLLGCGTYWADTVSAAIEKFGKAPPPAAS